MTMTSPDVNTQKPQLNIKTVEEIKSKRIKIDATPKCSQCHKKLTITRHFNCRCGYGYCRNHKHPETHSCTFDYKSEGRKKLELENPIVKAKKL